MSTIKDCTTDANKAKSLLMDLERRLLEIKGGAKAAKELGTIIGRLEHWQHKHN